MESEKLIGGGAISVAQLVRNARRLVETGFGRLWVTGEVIGFSRAASGHCYFSLKDEDAQIDCVLFRATPNFPICRATAKKRKFWPSRRFLKRAGDFNCGLKKYGASARENSTKNFCA